MKALATLVIGLFADSSARAPSSAVSPDGRNELRLDVGKKGMAYSVWRSDKAALSVVCALLAGKRRKR